MSINNPLVSIIIPVYNSEEYIDETIESILNQTYTNWEAILVDDCSQDSTQEKIKKRIEKNNKIKYFKHSTNLGAAEARNTAIKKAKGDFIAFLDSDDIWEKQKLEKQVQFMIDNNINFSCTYYRKMDEKSNDLNTVITYDSVGGYSHLLKECPGNSTVVYNTKKLGKFFIPNIKKRNDYVMWLQVIKKAGKIYCLKQQLSWHRVRSDSLSSDKLSLIKYHWYIYRKIEHLSYFYSLSLVSYWIFKSIKVFFPFNM